MPKRLSGWLVGAAVGVLFGGILAMDAVADARAATLVVDVQVHGVPAPGDVQVRAENGPLVLQGPSHQPLRVPAGTYEVVVSCPAARTTRVLHAVRLAAQTTVRRVVRFAAPRR